METPDQVVQGMGRKALAGRALVWCLLLCYATVAESFLSYVAPFLKGASITGKSIANAPFFSLGLKPVSVRVPVFATLRMGVMDDEGPLVSGQGPKSGKDAAADGLSALERAKIWEEVDELNEKMDLAVEGEQYGEAAELRDRITSLKMRDPYTRAEVHLDQAVEAEDYTEAARLRALMKEVGKPPIRRKKEIDIGKLARAMGAPESAAGEEQRGRENSDTVTRGIRVEVASYYLPGPSSPADGRLMFGYNVTITNLNEQTCQLVSRTWVIKSAMSDKKEMVSGSGVVGRQPVLGHNESFSYSSVCPLTIDRQWLRNNLSSSRLVGSMEGSYLMVSGATGQESFQALIDPFFFTLPSDVNVD